MAMYRQGDLLFVDRDDDFGGSDDMYLRRQGRRVTLARGEATGHAHVAVSERADLTLYVTDELADQVPVAPSGGTVLHDEHAPLVLTPGRYIVRRQREWGSDDFED